MFSELGRGEVNELNETNELHPVIPEWNDYDDEVEKKRVLKAIRIRKETKRQRAWRELGEEWDREFRDMFGL